MSIKIGIMGAIHEEINSILECMSNITIVELGSRKYYIGKIGQYEVLLVFSRWGKVAASTTASALITEFKIDQLIFTGVAGATNLELNIGDIVIADRLYQHDMDARPLVPKLEIPLTGTTFFNADKTLMSMAQTSANNLFSSISQKIPSEVLQSFCITAPKYMTGTIATGDQFINNSQTTQAIVADVSDTLAVEMEGAAVAQVCSDYNLPFIVIRTISDKANHDAAIDFTKFVNTIACHYTKYIVLDMLSN